MDKPCNLCSNKYILGYKSTLDHCHGCINKSLFETRSMTSIKNSIALHEQYIKEKYKELEELQKYKEEQNDKI